MERFPLPSDIDDSINSISPPTDVHASPVTTPATVLFSYLSLKNFFGPRTSLRKSSSFELLSLELDTIFLALFLINLAICFSRLRTPDSLV